MFKNNLRESSAKQTPGQKKGVFLGRRLIPLIISGLILYYYFERVDWPRLHQAILNANLFLFIPARLIPLFIYQNCFYGFSSH
jgi:hypothetical protein